MKQLLCVLESCVSVNANDRLNCDQLLEFMNEKLNIYGVLDRIDYEYFLNNCQNTFLKTILKTKYKIE